MPPAQTIAICGLGQMGAAAAACFKRAGYRVLAWDLDPARLAGVEATVAGLEEWLDRHMGPAPGPGGRLEPAGPATIDALAEVVLDCISEEMEHKAALFRQFPGCRERAALFLSATSGLSITALGRAGGCGHLLAGTHFWNPPHLMPLVEVVRGEDTPAPVVERACELVRSIGKIPVRVNRDAPGFIGNRMLHALWREAIDIVERGIASAEDVDLVARLTFGLRLPALGPLENMDLVGLDLIETIHRYLLADLADNHGPAASLSASVEQGRLGVKSGQGFYDWSARPAEALRQRRDLQIVHQLKFLQALADQAGDEEM